MAVKPIIDHDRKFIYFMIPKAACSSIRHWILKNQKNNPDLEYHYKSLFRLKKVDYEDLHLYTDYYWFTFLRDPIKRVISCYNDKVLSEVGDQTYKALYNPDQTFYEFVQYVYKTSDKLIDWHVKSQAYYISNFLSDMDFIGIVDNFDQGIKVVQQALNLKYEPGILRKTSPKDNLITLEIEKKIKIRYAEDYKLINFFQAVKKNKIT